MRKRRRRGRFIAFTFNPHSTYLRPIRPIRFTQSDS